VRIWAVAVDQPRAAVEARPDGSTSSIFFFFFVSGNVTFRRLDQADKKYGTFIGADEKYRTFIEKLPLASSRRTFRGETFVGSGRWKFMCFL
jgi:hypothetical protein